jgi:hypothetical protein
MSREYYSAGSLGYVHTVPKMNYLKGEIVTIGGDNVIAEIFNS